ncbi:MAG TPA: glycosyltransferase family 2 protein [Rhizomicrobium sp.]|jgi:glycosyltransferase involved in cell wall biosynthesis
MESVSCIIPAYNEGTRIANVLSAVVSHPLLEEIIVVDDGSTDETQTEAKRFSNVRVLVQSTNTGKSAAICAGVLVSTSPLLLFLDADLVGLTQSDVSKLIFPVLREEADASISLRGDALLPWRAIGLDYLSGERALRRDLFVEHLDVIAHLPGFGLESYINQMLIERNARVRIVRWANVGHTYKSKKHGIWNGLAGEARMLANIVETSSIAGSAHQIVELRRHRV